MRVIYAATRNADQTEGRGPMVPIAHFDNKSDAEFACKGWLDGRVEEIMVYASQGEWKSDEQEKIRLRALSKLSEEEQAALGFKKKK